MPPSRKHGSRFKKEKRGERKVLSPNQVAEKCNSGKVRPRNRKAIKVAIDDFFVSPLVKKEGLREADTGGTGVYLTVDLEKGEEIVKQFITAGILPVKANCVDFTTTAAKTMGGDMAPWILRLELTEEEKEQLKLLGKPITIESILHPDTKWNESTHLGEIFTLLYVARKEPGPIEYKIFGRKKGDVTEKEIPHIINLNSVGSWMTFPSSNYHQGSGAERTIISLQFVIDDEE